MRPDEIACPHVSPGRVNCGAQAGQVCRDFAPAFHAERIALAAWMERSVDPVSVEVFGQAVEGSELL